MRLYLDASAIIYAVESVAPFRDRVIARIAQAGGAGELVTSQLSRLECRVKPLREANTIVLQRFDDFFTRRGLMVADLSAAIIDRATELRARSGFGTPDALHLATAVELAADVFLTGDDRLERCDSVRVEGGPVMSDRRTWDQEADREESMTDEFLDCTGRVRTFRLSVYAAGRFLEAVELLGGGERGLRFVLPAGPDGEIPWGRMRQALRDRLAGRDIARDPRSGRLQLLSNVVRAQLRSTAEDEDGPTVLIDDLKLSWADFGRLFESYEGWHLRVEIRDLDDAPSG